MIEYLKNASFRKKRWTMETSGKSPSVSGTKCQGNHFRFRFAFLPVFVVAPGYGQDALRYRFQLYDEEDGRIDVESHYLDYKHQWEATSFGLRLAVDSLSGMTPVGTHTRDDDNEWVFQEIEDERRVVVATIEQEINDYLLTFEYAHSKEVDYRSNAVTAKISSEFNQKNTTVTAGVSYAFDKVLATNFTNIFDDEDKDTLDFNIGISQILSRNTIFDFNFGYGYTEGYLADPYRRISQIQSFVIDTPFGSFPVTDTFDYPENRPDELHRFVAKASVRHYFQAANAALKASYRFYANSDSVEGHTFELKWIQQLTPQVSATPFVRYYQQSSADYYYSSLTDSGIDGSELNDGTAPHYSSDYRLSAFDAFTYGVRLAWEVRPELTLDLQLERYEMNGRDSETPDIFFPSANVVSVGAQWNF